MVLKPGGTSSEVHVSWANSEEVPKVACVSSILAVARGQVVILPMGYNLAVRAADSCAQVPVCVGRLGHSISAPAVSCLVGAQTMRNTVKSLACVSVPSCAFLNC